MKIRIEDTVYEGTGTEIMDQLRKAAFDPTEFFGHRELYLAASQQFHPHDGSGLSPAGSWCRGAGADHDYGAGEDRRTGGVGP